MAFQHFKFHYILIGFLLTCHSTIAEENPFLPQNCIYPPSAFLIEVRNDTVGDREYKQARQVELALIQQKVAELIPVNSTSIIKHYASCVKNYIDLWKCAKHLHWVVEQTDEWMQKQNTSENREALSEDKTRILIDQVNWYVERHLSSHPIFAQFRTDLRSFLIMPNLRTRVYQQVSLLILKKVIKLKNQIEDWAFLPSNQDFTSNKPDLRALQGNAGITPVQLYVTDQTDVGGFHLCQVINELSAKRQITDPTSLSEDEICLIHDQIQENKKKNIIEWDVLEFVHEPKGLVRLIAYKNTLPEYRGRLFYGFPEIYHLMKEGNVEYIKVH